MDKAMDEKASAMYVMGLIKALEIIRKNHENVKKELKEAIENHIDKYKVDKDMLRVIANALEENNIKINL